MSSDLTSGEEPFSLGLGDFLPWHHWKYFLCLTMVSSPSRPMIRLCLFTGFQNSPMLHLLLLIFKNSFLDLYWLIQFLYFVFRPCVCFRHNSFCCRGFPLKLLIGLLSLSILTFFLHLNCFKKFKLFSCLGPAFLFHSPLCHLSCLTIVTTILLNSKFFYVISTRGHYYGNCTFFFSRWHAIWVFPVRWVGICTSGVCWLRCSGC